MMARAAPPLPGCDTAAMARLMPMFLCVNGAGVIGATGPTLAKLLPGLPLVGWPFDQVFDLRRPRGLSLADLAPSAGERLHLVPRRAEGVELRGLATALAEGGWLINLSLGIGVIEAVGRFGLTEADFAPTDLTIELLYLVEAKALVLQELRQLTQRLQTARLAAEEQALTDALTGLHNRRALHLALNRLIASGGGFGLMHVDLDFFKQVNDSFGHAAGDHVLREVARILRDATRQGDTVARVGGDEFVLVLPGLADPGALLRIAGRIIAGLSQPLPFQGQTCRIAASIGVTHSGLYPAPAVDRVLNDADTALYRAKDAGRAQAMMFAPEIWAGAPGVGAQPGTQYQSDTFG